MSRPRVLVFYGLVVLLVVTLDAWFIAVMIASWELAIVGAVSVCALVVAIRYWRSYSTPAPVDGWDLGMGKDVTNPIKPKNVRVIIPQSALTLGMLGVGSPGSGKTFSIGIGYSQYLSRRADVKGQGIIDGKGDIDFYLNLLRAGIPLHHFFSSELPGTDSINLFEGEAFDVIDRCARFLIPQTTTTSFYSDEQRATLNRIVPIIKALGQPVTLRDFYCVMSVPDAAIELLQLARQANLPETVMTLAHQWFALEFEERLRLNGGLLSRMFIFVAGPQADRFNAYQPDISLHDCMAQGKSVFFHLPYSEFAKDIAIAVVEMFGVEARKRQLAGPDTVSVYPLLFEDYGGFFHENFGPISARCRSAKMPLNFTFQSLAQLIKVDKTFYDELDDNLATKIVLRVMGEQTSNFAINLLGEFETRELAKSAHAGREGTQLHFLKEARIDVQDLRELPAGAGFISTLVLQAHNAVKNALYHIQFPGAEFDAAVVPALPAHTPFVEGEGLGFWSKYMNPSRLSEIRQQLHADMVRHADVI